MKLNLYSCVIFNKKGCKIFRKAENNNRYKRKRPQKSKKAFCDEELGDDSIGILSVSYNVFGQAWAEKYVGGKDMTPSFDEMMQGIHEWFYDQMVNRMKDKDKLARKMIFHKNKFEFNKLINRINLKKSAEPMTMDQDIEIGLYNPYSQVTCFILYLYTMEFGTPPLYHDLNRVTREMKINKD